MLTAIVLRTDQALTVGSYQPVVAAAEAALEPLAQSGSAAQESGSPHGKAQLSAVAVGKTEV